MHILLPIVCLMRMKEKVKKVKMSVYGETEKEVRMVILLRESVERTRSDEYRNLISEMLASGLKPSAVVDASF